MPRLRNPTLERGDEKSGTVGCGWSGCVFQTVEAILFRMAFQFFQHRILGFAACDLGGWLLGILGRRREMVPLSVGVQRPHTWHH